MRFYFLTYLSYEFFLSFNLLGIRTCSKSCWSFLESVWNGTKHRTHLTAMNNSLAVVSCKISQLGSRISIEPDIGAAVGKSTEL